MRVTATKLLGILALASVATCPTYAKRRVLHYGPEKVAVTGRVVYRTFYGPPNYGENPKTDSQETQDILLLESAVDVIATGNDPMDQTERRVTRITLVIDHSIRHLIGKRVVIEGTLFHAHTGHHHTKVLMEVSSIKRAK
jgi:Domain of unknown function (DUF4431)